MDTLLDIAFITPVLVVLGLHIFRVIKNYPPADHRWRRPW